MEIGGHGYGERTATLRMAGKLRLKIGEQLAFGEASIKDRGIRRMRNASLRIGAIDQLSKGVRLKS